MTKPIKKVEIPAYKDKNVGLVAFGILQIFMGGICFLLIPLMLFGMIVSNMINKSGAMPLSLPMMVQSILFYVLMAGWFIWMGVGSIRARRWARALILISSWFWLICGITGFIFWLIVAVPDTYKNLFLNGQIPQYAVSIIKIVTGIFLVGLYIIFPSVFILFYGSENVKVTCEFRDPKVRWTDKCPLPVLALSFMFVIAVLSMLQMALYNFLIPFFGSLLSGKQGAFTLLIVVLMFIYLAVGTYKLKMSAWWSAIVVMFLGTVSTIMTFSRISLLEFYQKMNFSEQQLKLIQQMGILQNFSMNWYSIFWTVVFLGYLLYTRRFFVSGSKSAK